MHKLDAHASEWFHVLLDDGNVHNLISHAPHAFSTYRKYKIAINYINCIINGVHFRLGNP